MNNFPKISVIIPSYNRFNFLLNAITSVTNQDYPNIELIIINDGSSDEQYYSKKLYNILPSNSIVINNTLNSGNFVKEGKAAYTRNMGLKLASGDYIAFLDDDDIWLPNKLKTQIEYMEKTGCKMSCSEGLIGNGFYDQTKKYPLYNSEYHSQFFHTIGIYSFPGIWNKNFLSKHNSCINSSVIISKDIVDKIGLINYIRVGEDYDYFMRVLDHTNCVYIDKPLIYYDLNHGNGILY